MRKERSDKGKIQITDRDIAVLTWIGEQYAVRLDTLQKLLGREATQETVTPGLVGERGAQRVVDRWERAGLVKSKKFFYRKPPWVWLTAHGLRQMGLDYKPKDPKVSMLNHMHDINEVRVRIERQLGPEATWRSERALRKERHGDKVYHVPDGEVRYQGGFFAVEIELTQKASDRIEAIVRKLEAQYDGVWFFVSDTARRPVESTVKKILGNESQRVRFYDIASVRASSVSGQG